MSRNDNSTARRSYTFGGYEILETTGSGGMGVVYRALDKNLDRIVALKVLRDDLRAQSHIVARFKREAEAFATLDHPHIVRIYSVGMTGKIPYIAMQYIDGEPLSAILQARAPLPWQEALGIGGQIAQALACAHKAQIVHRDIKPANILMDTSGKAYVTDFGIAKILNATTQLTADGKRLGTPQYMCPERCSNKAITPASDIFSLGVLLFQCLTGHLPFSGSTPVEVIHNIASEPPARIREYQLEIPEAVERLIAYMLEKNPKQRPNDAAVLAETIERVLQGAPLETQNDEMSSAIASFRKSLPTPTPPEGMRHTPTTPLPRLSLAKRIRMKWFRLSSRLRLALAGTCIVGTAALTLAGAYPLLTPELPESLFSTSQEVQRWYPETSDFFTRIRETEEVTLLEAALPNFTCAHLEWVQGGNRAVLQCEGQAATSQESQNAFFSVIPATEEAVLLAPPAPAYRNLLGGWCDSNAQPGLCFHTPASTDFQLAGATTLPERLADLSAGAIAYHAPSQHLALSFATSDAHSWVLAETALATPNKKTLRTHAGASITGIAYSPSGKHLAYVRERTASMQEKAPQGLWLLTAQEESLDGQHLLQGNVQLSHRPFSADGKHLAITENSSDIVILDIETGKSHVNAGKGHSVCWHPQENYLVTIAPDRAGRAQLWRTTIANDTQVQHKQLTHLDSGVASQLVLSDDGRYAITTLPNTATAIVVDLS